MVTYKIRSSRVIEERHVITNRAILVRHDQTGLKYYEEHFLDGRLHREDGPAIQWHYFVPHLLPSLKDFYLNGKKYSESEYLLEITKLKYYDWCKISERPWNMD